MWSGSMYPQRRGCGTCYGGRQEGEDEFFTPWCTQPPSIVSFMQNMKELSVHERKTYSPEKPNCLGN